MNSREIGAWLSARWWRVLSAVGLTKEGWLAVDPLVRKAIKAGFWLAVGVFLVAIGGVWNLTVLGAAALVFLLAVIPWDRYPRGQWVVPGVLLILAVLYPKYRGDLFGFPVFGPVPQMDTMVVMMIFTMMALGLNVVVGYAGLLDLGYVAFYAIGAYMAGWFASSQFATHTFHLGAVGITPDAVGFHVSIWLILVAAGFVTAFVGVVIGLPTLRLRGDYLAIVTLGFGEIIPQIARNGDNLFGTGFNLTGGTQGLTPIDGPGFGGWLNDHLGLPENYLVASNQLNLFYWTALALVLFTVFCSLRLRESRLGRAWIAIREDETAAAAMGIPLMRTKTWAYATGAFFGGIAGAYYASYKSATFPDDFFFNISVFILCMIILGGMGNIPGVIFGACFLSYLDREGLANVGGWMNGHFSEAGFNVTAGVLMLAGAVAVFVLANHLLVRLYFGGILTAVGLYLVIKQPIGLPLDVPLYEFGIFGVILVVVMLFRPEGLIPSRRRALELHEGVHDKPLYDTAGPVG